MMKKLHLLRWAAFMLLSAQLYINNATAQYYRPENNVWALANTMGLDFNSGSPTLIGTSVQTSHEGVASVCNSQGQLLFYTNGEQIWDRNHNMMPNGNIDGNFVGLMTEDACGNAQLALIVPFINDTNKYYLFTNTRYNPFFSFPGNVYYSVIDMSLNGGLGDVVPGSTKLLEATSYTATGETIITSTKMTAVPGNNCNIWVIRTYADTTQVYYRVYEVSVNGLDTVPIISTSSIPMSVGGYISVSNNRKKIASSNWLSNYGSGSLVDSAGLIVADFNSDDGTITNPVYLDSLPDYYMSLSFSPDDSRLYALTQNQLFQFDMTAPNPAATKTLIGIASGSNGYRDMKLAPDGKIYIQNVREVDVINQPNLLDTACQYTLSAFSFASPYRPASGFPNTVIVARKQDSVFTKTDTLVCSSDWNTGISINANLINTDYRYIWSNGDTGTTISITQPGTYWVRYRDEYGCYNYTDTFSLEGSDIYTSITVSGFELGTTGGPFVTYQWYLNGNAISEANASTYVVTENGFYTVAVTDEKGCTFLSDVYEVTNVGIATNTLSEQITIIPNPAYDYINIQSPVSVYAHLYSIEGKLIKTTKVDKTGILDIRSLSNGIYLLQLSDATTGDPVRIDKIVKF